jgi:hypothetical protein
LRDRNAGLPDDTRQRFLAVLEKLREVLERASAPRLSRRSEKPHMSSKRDDRKQRSEAERLERERLKRSQVARRRLLLVAGIVAVLAVTVLAVTRRQGDSGRVWSAEHGHWHEK